MANTDGKKIFKIASISFLMLFIIVFAIFTSREVLFGVKIKDVNIIDGTRVVNNIIEIKGNAKNAVNLTLNDRPISIDQKGNFNETIALLAGYNVISIKARDGFGNDDKKIYKLMY